MILIVVFMQKKFLSIHAHKREKFYENENWETFKIVVICAVCFTRYKFP